MALPPIFDRLRLRALGKIPVQCHITFLKRTTNEWSRFVDRHPIATSVLMATALLVFLGALVFSGVAASGLLRT